MNLKHGLTGLAAFSALMLGTAILTPTVSLAQNESNWRSQWKLEPIDIAIDLYEEKFNTENQKVETEKVVAAPVPTITEEEFNELQFFVDSKIEDDAKPVELKVPVKSEEKEVEIKEIKDVEVKKEVARTEEKSEKKAALKTSKKVEQTTFKPVTKKEASKSADRYQLGISLMRLSDSTRKKYKIPSDVGYGIRYIQDDSAADKAGLKKSDIIVGMGKKSVKSSRDLAKAVQKAGEGKEELKLSVLRDGKKMDVSVQPMLAMKRSRSAATIKRPTSSDKKSPSRGPRGASDMRDRMKKMFESLSKDDQAKVKKIVEEMKDIRTKAMKSKGKLSDKDKSRARELMGSLMKMRSKISGGSSDKDWSSRRADYMKKMQARLAANRGESSDKKSECSAKGCKGCDKCKGGKSGCKSKSCKGCDKCKGDKSDCKSKGCKGCGKCKDSRSHDHKGHHSHVHGKKTECKGKDCKSCESCKGKKPESGRRPHGDHHGHRGHGDHKPPHHGDKKDDHHGHKGHHGPPPHARHGDKKDDHGGRKGHHGPPPHHAHRGSHHGPKGDSHHKRPGGDKGCGSRDCKKGSSDKGHHSSHRGSRHGKRDGGHHGSRRGGKSRSSMGMMMIMKRLVDKIEDLTDVVEDLTKQVEDLTDQLEDVEEKLGK